MKVTVCFGEMKVIVPCSDGDLTVLELIGRAVSRFKKASQEARAMDITVHCLKTCEELAILDIDDLVSDVCDDKDKLIAVYEERPKQDVQSNDQRQGNLSDAADNSQYISVVSDDDSGVTADAWNGNSSSARASLNMSSNIPRGIQRKLPHAKNNSFRSSASSNSPTSSPEVFRRAQNNGLSPFSRDLGRKSLSINHPMLYSWIDQQDRMRGESLSDPLKSDLQSDDMVDLDDNLSVKSSESAEIELDKETAGAITIKPYATADGREMGLVVHDIVEGSIVDGAGGLQTADQITEINGVSLRGRSNAEAKSLYEAAVNSNVIKLKRTRSHNFSKSHSIESTPVIPSPPPRHISSPAKQLLKRIPDTNVKESKEIGIEAPEASPDDKPSNDKVMFNVNLVKGKDGLGFSVSSKDVLINNSRDFFVKTVLGKGAAVEDGRIKPGDQILKINDESISEKSQQDVVKILRNATGTISIILKRDRQNDCSDPDVKSDDIISCVPEKGPKPVLPRPIIESDKHSTSRPVSSVIDRQDISTPPLPKRVPAPRPIVERQDFSRPISGESLSPLPDEIFTLSIPLSSERTSGLGISVKGKRREGAEQEDRGIYIKSVIKGGAAERDGRLQANDQLLCISGTSLIGISNNEAMNILRESMQGAVHDGQINLIVGRPAATSNFGSPLIGSTAIQRGRPISMVGIGSEGGDDIDQKFEDMYLKKHHMSPLSHKVVRNQSYFRALDPPIVTGFNEQIDKNIPSSNTSSSVSVGSSRILPVTSNAKNIISHMTDDKLSSRTTSLPTYEEALQRNTSLSRSSTSSSTHSQKNLRGSGRRYQGDMQFESLPDKMSAKDMSMRDSEKRHSLDASQTSLDTLLMGPSHMPFSRDAFGRLSMSEKKGRAQLDANKSNLYNKLKKYKSMEEIRVSVSGDSKDVNVNEPVKRTESLDTLISKVDEEERLQDNVIFNRGTLYASSTPWYSPNNERKKKRGRNQPMNDSLQEALEQTGAGHNSRANDSVNSEKKKKGFLKGIGDLLKGKKKTKDEYRNNRGRSLSPRRSSDAIKRQEAQLRSSNQNLRKARSSSRPLSMSEDMLASLTSKDDKEFEKKYNKVDQIQKELVNAQIAEKERKKKEQKKREKMISKVKVTDSPEPKYNIYSTWDAHTPENFREKSRQMYSKKDPNDSSKGLQRQSSLPPRAKKNSSDNFRRDVPISASVPVTSRQNSNSSTSSDNRLKNVIKIESNSGLKTNSPLPRVKHYTRTPAKEEKPLIRDSTSSQGQPESSVSSRTPTPKTQSIADLTSNTIISISHTADI